MPAPGASLEDDGEPSGGSIVPRAQERILAVGLDQLEDVLAADEGGGGSPVEGPAVPPQQSPVVLFEALHGCRHPAIGGVVPQGRPEAEPVDELIAADGSGRAGRASLESSRPAPAFLGMAKRSPLLRPLATRDRSVCAIPGSSNLSMDLLASSMPKRQASSSVRGSLPYASSWHSLHRLSRSSSMDSAILFRSMPVGPKQSGRRSSHPGGHFLYFPHYWQILSRTNSRARDGPDGNWTIAPIPCRSGASRRCSGARRGDRPEGDQRAPSQAGADAVRIRRIGTILPAETARNHSRIRPVPSSFWKGGDPLMPRWPTAGGEADKGKAQRRPARGAPGGRHRSLRPAPERAAAPGPAAARRTPGE